MKQSVSTDVRMRDAIPWDPGCSDDEIEYTCFIQNRHPVQKLVLCYLN